MFKTLSGRLCSEILSDLKASLLFSIQKCGMKVVLCGGRDHPSNIKKRFISVTIVCLISPPYLYFCLNKNILQKYTLWELLGIRSQGLLQAALMPLLLTVVLFLGPLVLQIKNRTHIFQEGETYWLENVTNFPWLRNQVVAPITEELIYRACLVPLLRQCFSYTTTIFICPVFFGAAHFNHFWENVRAGIEYRTALQITMFQFMYTTVFGAYSTFLFLRTGHLIAPTVTHTFCNYMGFPDFTEVLSKFQFAVFTILGVVLWSALLLPLTEPELYSNDIYWNNNYSIVN